MNSRDIIEIFDSFLSLGGGKGLDKRDIIVDSEIFPFVYLREINGNWIIYLLPIGTKIIIPHPWPILWTNFIVYGGSEVVNWDKEKGKLTDLQKFAISFFWLSSALFNRYWDSPGKFEDIWEKNFDIIYSLGTSTFRNWIKEKHEVDLEPWTIENFENEYRKI